jgi:hypothetical protein
VEVEATELFLKNYRRTNNRSQIRNTLLTLRQRMDSSPNWLHSYEHITNCALKTTFRAKLSKGDRLLLNHKPPLLVLDFGPHDPTYNRWDKGHTSSKIQIERAEKLGIVPDWLRNIFGEREVA